MSALLELHPELERNALDTAFRPGESTSDLPDPGIFSGSLSKSLGKGAMTGVVKIGTTTEAYFNDAWARGLDVVSGLLPTPQGGGRPDVLSHERAGQTMNREATAKAIADLRPNPHQDGVAAQVLHSLGDVLTRATVGSVAAGPFGSAGTVGLSEEYSSRVVSESEGIDPVTAQKKSVVDAVTTGAGVLIPGSNIVKGKAADALLTIGGNVLLGISGRAANRQILESGGYTKQAQQHDPFDPVAIATDTLLGGGFWGLSRFTHARAESQMQGSESDAVRTKLNGQHYAEGSAPGTPADPASAHIHAENMEESILALAEGRMPKLRPETSKAQFIPRPTDSAARELVRSALPIEQRFTPSSRLESVSTEKRRALRYDAPELNEYAATIEQRYGLPGGLINALKNAGEKSNSTQVSPAGAAGVMQFMPENLKKYGVVDATDPVQMIDAAGRYLRDTMKQYGGNIDAVIADYNGGPRQARRVMNGEPPKAAETVGYLNRVRAYMDRQDRPYAREAKIEDFAKKTGRRVAVDAENRPIFEDGTAFPREAINDFYEQRVAHLGKADTAPMPDVLFRIGEVDDFTAAGLRDFLPGFNDNLREARISAQSIRNIHDSRPGIAREVLQRLDDGALYADEVLPNPKNSDRALVVLRDVSSGSDKLKNAVTVLEVAANGKGIDVVTAMTALDGSLNKARELKRKIIEERGGTVQDGGAAYPSSSLADSLANQPHAAADFPTFAQNRETSIAQPAEVASNVLRTLEAQPTVADAVNKAGDMVAEAVDSMRPDPGQQAKQAPESPTLRAATEAVNGSPDMVIRMEDGTDISARDALLQAREEVAKAENDSQGFMAAITCFLRKG